MDSISVEQAYKNLWPETAVFVLSRDLDGRASGMIAGWNMLCSVDPPLVAVALSKRGFTHKMIKASREFVIAVPDLSLLKSVQFFGSNHGDVVDKIKETGIATEEGVKTRCVLLPGAKMNLECAHFKTVDAGDHFVFIGRVLAAHKGSADKTLMNKKEPDGSRTYLEL